MKRFLFLLFLLLSKAVTAALPITHIVLAEEWLKNAPIESPWDRREFLLGNLFPDIRYVAAIPREKTHWIGLSVEQIAKEPNPFFRGMQLHALVDELRAAWMERWGIHDLFPDLPLKHRATFYKLLEDEVLYERVRRDEVQEALYQGSLYEEIPEIDERGLWRWHMALDVYFSISPSELTRLLCDKGKGLWGVTPEELGEWSQWLRTLSQNSLVQKYVDTMINEVASQFSL